MYRYRPLCSFNTMSQLINRSDWYTNLDSLAINVSTFVVGHTIEEAPVCDAPLRVAASMVSEMRGVYAVENVVELFMQTFAVLQTTPVLDSGLLT
ncbi:hypothetical protein TNCV_8951 [Trichonephila clavipes]|nr:hypothetical protein TNCV_8951 [Trichonephila clavipes]